MDYYSRRKANDQQTYSQKEVDQIIKEILHEVKVVKEDHRLSLREKDFEYKRLQAEMEFKLREEKLLNALSTQKTEIEHLRKMLAHEKTIAEQNLALGASKMMNELGGDDYIPPGNAEGLFGVVRKALRDARDE